MHGNDDQDRHLNDVGYRPYGGSARDAKSASLGGSESARDRDEPGWYDSHYAFTAEILEILKAQAANTNALAASLKGSNRLSRTIARATLGTLLLLVVLNAKPLLGIIRAIIEEVEHPKQDQPKKDTNP